MTYKIVKAYAETETGNERIVWNVIDASDDYIVETFDLKRDAKAWMIRNCEK